MGSAMNENSGVDRDGRTGSDALANRPQLGEFSEAWVQERARRLYETGEAKIDLDPRGTALIVVDMIDEFVKPHWSPYWVPQATAAVPRIRRVIDAFHRAGLPVIYLAYEIGQRGLNTPVTDKLMPTTMDCGPWVKDLWREVTFYEEIAPQGNDLVVLRHSYSGFYASELEPILRSSGVTTVVISGTLTNFCCGATAREAFWRGFAVIFGSDVNATDDDDAHEAELRVLRRGYARIMVAEEIISELERASASGADASAQGSEASELVPNN
jgi:nicotinamidase-related amidase